MKICLLGQPLEKVDEGMKNIGYNLYKYISKDNDVIYIPIHSMRSIVKGVRQIHHHNPDVIHLIPGPTTKGLFLTKTLSKISNSRIVITASNPKMEFGKFILSQLEPDLVAVQSESDLSLFKDYGFTTQFIPNGVDLNKFSPSTKDEKYELRDKFDLPHDEYVFLHVGHFKTGRGIETLQRFLDWGEVVIVGSPSTDPDAILKEDLQRAGVRVFDDYFPAIEEFYQASDMYVFPTVNENNSIQMPVSVLEAMACDLPVISTKYGGIYDQFKNEDSIMFVDDIRNINKREIETMMQKNTRRIAEEYSFDAIAQKYNEIYKKYE